MNHTTNITQSQEKFGDKVDFAQIEGELAEFKAFHRMMAEESRRGSRETEHLLLDPGQEESLEAEYLRTCREVNGQTMEIVLEKKEEVKDGEVRLSCVGAQLERIERLVANMIAAYRANQSRLKRIEKMNAALREENEELRREFQNWLKKSCVRIER